MAMLSYDPQDDDLYGYDYTLPNDLEFGSTEDVERAERLARQVFDNDDALCLVDLPPSTLDGE